MACFTLTNRQFYKIIVYFNRKKKKRILSPKSSDKKLDQHFGIRSAIQKDKS